MIPGNHDSRNVGYVHFEELFGERNSVLRKDGVTVVAVDSTEPDLDHGQIGRGRYGWIEQEFAGPARLRIFVLHHHLLPVPGTGRERNVVYDAGDAIECLQRAGVNLVLSGHKHVPYAWRLENLFVVNTGTVSTLRLRGNTRPCYNVIEVSGSHVAVWRRYPFHGQERIIQFDLETLEYEKYTSRIENEVTAAAMRAVALIDGEHAPDVVRRRSSSCRTSGSGRSWSAAARSCGRGEGYGVPLLDGFGDAEVVVDLSDEPVLGPDERFRWASRALAAGLTYIGADFRFDPPVYEEIERAVDRRDRHRQAGGEDRRLGAPRAAARPRPRRRGRDDGAGRAARARADRRAARRSTDLVALSRSGRHAASDHLEIAAVSGVPTIGCRRAGGGLAGKPFVSNVARRRPPGGRAQPRHRRLRRQRHRDPADRGRPARARRRLGPRSSTRTSTPTAGSSPTS